MSIYFDAITERRFYPRISPTRPLYVAFGGSNLAMLLNLSENGLLVSTPAALDPNSVFRISIQLNGIPKAIEVNVRTIWTGESKERAGIQILDLSDHDREQIRKWGALEATLDKSEDAKPADAAYPPDEMPASAVPLVQAVEPDAVVSPPVPPSWPRYPEVPAYLAPKADPPGLAAASELPNFPASRSAVLPRRPRRRSSVAAIVAWGAVASVVCLGAALFLDPGIAKQLLGQPASDSVQLAPRATSSDSSPVDKVENTAPADRATPTAKPSFHSTAARLEDQSDDALESAAPPAPESKRKPADNGDSSAGRRTSEPPTSSPATSAAVPSASAGTIPSSSPEAATKPAAPAGDPATPAQSSVTTAQPSTNAVDTSPRSTAGPANTSSYTPGVSGSSAIAGSIGISSTSAANAAPHSNSFAPVTPNSAPTAAGPAGSAPWPTSGPPVAAGKSPNSLFHSRPPDASPVVQMDVNPGPVMAITAPRGIGSSFITIPGERVIDSPGMTVHIRRAIRVPSEHWIWRGRKQVAMGELATRIDPQPVHQPASGSITVQATVDKDGRVTDLRPLNGSFSFLPGVARAVREWRYEPTYLDGKPVETRAEIEIDFHIATAANHP